jgi:hypothetical protein
MLLIVLSEFRPAIAKDLAETPVAGPISFPLDIILPNVASLRSLAETRPIAAAAILSIIQARRSPFAAYTDGQEIILTGVPTADTVTGMLEHASDAVILGSLQPLWLNPYYPEQGPYLKIWWDQSTLPNGETLLRFSSLLVDGAGAAFGSHEPVEESTIVALRKGDGEQLTWVR